MDKLKIKKIVVGPVHTNCYLILSDNELVVVDPGGEAEKIAAEIEKLGKVNCKYILLTHGHYDHVMAINEIRDRYACLPGQGFEVVVGEKDKDIAGLNAEIGVQVLDIKADILLKDGQVLAFGGEKIQVLETPGHTRGGVSYLIGDNLFSGDTLFKASYGRTDLSGGSVEDMIKSLERLLKLDENTKVHPGHGPETTIGEEREYNAYKK